MSIKKLDNESGIILLIVVAFTILMSIILLGMFGRSSSTSLSDIERTKRIQADFLARGAFWIAYDALHASGGATMPADFVKTLNTIPYTVKYQRNSETDPDEIIVTVSYP